MTKFSLHVPACMLHSLWLFLVLVAFSSPFVRYDIAYIEPFIQYLLLEIPSAMLAIALKGRQA